MKTRGFALASATALISTLFSVVPAQADAGSWRPGWCREDEGLSIVVDYGPEGMEENPDLSLPVTGWDIRCLVGGEITVDDDYTRITALRAAGYALEGDGYVTGINGVSSGNGFWMFAGADVAAGEAWSQDRWNIAQFGPNTNIALGARYSSDWDDFVPRPNPAFGAPGVPSAPSAPTVSVTGQSATVTWAAPADNGAAITTYEVTLTPTAGAALSQKVTGTSATFTGLGAGTWTAAVVATNSSGDSTSSTHSQAFSVSAPVKPTPTAPARTTIQATAPSATWGARISSTVTVGAGARGTVTGTLNGRTARATVSGGKATLSWPAKTQRPGKATIAVTFASADTTAWGNATTTTRVTVAKTSAKVTVKAATKSVKRSKKVKLTIRVTGKAGDKATGKVKVRFRGRTTTATLKNGKAVVKVKATRALGKATAKVSYVGDGLHAKASRTSSSIRTVR